VFLAVPCGRIPFVQGTDFDEAAFFAAIARSGARALLIGRRAVIALGVPVQTSDYDLWIHVDDADALNRAVEPFGLYPNRDPAEARRVGRYVLENDEHVDVLVARALTTADGARLVFDDLWTRRKVIEVAPGVSLALPSVPDLIATKRIPNRPKDLEDIRVLSTLFGNDDGATS
jgi:hypothetical protein